MIPTLSILALFAVAAPVTDPTPAPTAPSSATVFHGFHPLAPGDALWLSHGGQVWTVSMSDEAPYSLQIGDHPHRTQALYGWEEAPEDGAQPVVRWAGDRDQDGRLDLIVEIRDRDGAQQMMWLSSLAEGKSHVGAVD